MPISRQGCNKFVIFNDGVHLRNHGFAQLVHGKMSALGTRTYSEICFHDGTRETIRSLIVVLARATESVRYMKT